MRKIVCPRDGTALAPRTKHHVEFYLCRKCHGLWLRKADLERLADRIVSSPNEPWTLPWQKSSGRTIIEGSARCICPRSPLMEVVEVDGINIDICPSCPGIWLDGGEIGKILGHDEDREKRAMAGGLIKEMLSMISGGVTLLISRD